MKDLYQRQRRMRALRKAAMQRRVIAVLDVGTSKIACLILRFDGPERFTGADGVGSMAGQSAFRVIGAATTRSAVSDSCSPSTASYHDSTLVAVRQQASVTS